MFVLGEQVMVVMIILLILSKYNCNIGNVKLKPGPDNSNRESALQPLHLLEGKAPETAQESRGLPTCP